MKQYRITATDFAPQDPIIPDAVMDASELAGLKRLAGITEETKPMGVASNWGGQMSAVGTSGTNTETLNKERELGIKPGDPAWFRLWFGDKR